MQIGTQRAVRNMVYVGRMERRDRHEVRWIAHHRGGADRRSIGRQHMKIIVDEDGEIIAKASDDHTLIGGHHRLAVAASHGKKLFWRDTGEPVKLDNFFKHYGSSLRHTA